MPTGGSEKLCCTPASRSPVRIALTWPSTQPIRTVPVWRGYIPPKRSHLHETSSSRQPPFQAVVPEKSDDGGSFYIHPPLMPWQFGGEPDAPQAVELVIRTVSAGFCTAASDLGLLFQSGAAPLMGAR